MNKTVKNNSYYLKVNVFKQTSSGVTPFDLQTCDTVEANIYQELTGIKFCHSVGRTSGITNQLIIDVSNVPLGQRYVIEVVGLYNSRAFRGAVLNEIGIVEYNAESMPIFNYETDITIDFVSDYLLIEKNAYELALQEGYTGTLSDFIAELVDNGDSARAARQATAEAISATTATIEATERANQAASSADSATVEAITATQQAITATTAANEATQEAILRASEAHEATEAANSATAKAKVATTASNEATAEAISATTETIEATAGANQAASAARTATNEATAATANAIVATENATQAANSATNAANSAITATNSANTAADSASTVASNTQIFLNQAQADEAIRISNENERINAENTRSEFYEHFDEELERKANKDGFYETLGAGTAMNLQGGTTVEANFQYRTAGGTDDIASGLATIQSIKGKTIVYNQLVSSIAVTPSLIEQDLSVTTEKKYITVYDSLSPSTTRCLAPTGNLNIPLGHKGIVYITYKTDYEDLKLRYVSNNTQTPNLSVVLEKNDTNNWITKKAFLNDGYRFGSSSGILPLDNIYIKDNYISLPNDGSGIQIFDLTLMFGTGNEPSTIEEFDEWLEKNIGKRSYYEYNEGTIINANAETLQTIGFNRWDGSYSVDNKFLNEFGDEITSSNNKEAISNYIPIFENTQYYISKTYGSNSSLCFYDKDYAYISGMPYQGQTSKLVTSPINAAYLRFTVYKENADLINVNLSWSGIKNGEYESYWKRNYNLYLNQIQGYDSNNNLVTVFPDGMKRVGDVYDEIIVSEGVTKAIVRTFKLNKNDIVSLNSNAVNENNAVRFLFENSLKAKGYLIISDKFITKNSLVSEQDAPWLISGYQNNNRIYLTIPSSELSGDLTTAEGRREAFYAWWDLNTPTIIAELDTPIEYTLVDFDLPLPYKVDDFGTEEFTNSSLSPTINIRYGLNAVDTLRRLNQNYVSVESMENFLGQLGLAMNGTWTMTFNNDSYNFNFTPNQEEENNG